MYTLTLEITKRCNLKCRYCYVQKNEDMMQLDVGLQIPAHLTTHSAKN